MRRFDGVNDFCVCLFAFDIVPALPPIRPARTVQTSACSRPALAQFPSSNRHTPPSITGSFALTIVNPPGFSMSTKWACPRGRFRTQSLRSKRDAALGRPMAGRVQAGNSSTRLCIATMRAAFSKTLRGYPESRARMFFSIRWHHRFARGGRIGRHAIHRVRACPKKFNSASPIASETQAIVLAVNWPPQAPGVGQANAFQYLEGGLATSACRSGSCPRLEHVPCTRGQSALANSAGTIRTFRHFARRIDARHTRTQTARSDAATPSSCRAAICRMPREVRRSHRNSGPRMVSSRCRQSTSRECQATTACPRGP